MNPSPEEEVVEGLTRFELSYADSVAVVGPAAGSGERSGEGRVAVDWNDPSTWAEDAYMCEENQATGEDESTAPGEIVSAEAVMKDVALNPKVDVSDDKGTEGDEEVVD